MIHTSLQYTAQKLFIAFLWKQDYATTTEEGYYAAPKYGSDN